MKDKETPAETLTPYWVAFMVYVIILTLGI